MNIGRSFDIDDIMLNLIGGRLGCIIYKFLDYIKEKLPNHLRKAWIYNILWLLILIISTLFLLDYYKVLEVI